VLTVDYDRLDLRPGMRVLDLGCGFGRHAFESLRRGASVIACDMARPELQAVIDTVAAMIDAGEVPADRFSASVTGDATRLPFHSSSFDRIIASEVMEHIPDDHAAIAELARVLAPGGIIAVTVPAALPEKICWKLNDEYHAPKCHGGHVRIYAHDDLQGLITDAGLTPFASHRAHALHSAYWWLRCAVGIENDHHPLVRPYTKLLEWDITRRPWLTQTTERLLNPILGKSLVQYARKPEGTSTRVIHVAA
jgi:SAM-dependent methyltransferase